MKKVIILLVCLISAIYSYAQVRNDEGEKVIRQIEVFMANAQKPYMTISFNYSNGLDLEEIHVNAPASFRISWKRNRGNLTRVEYDTDRGLRKDLIYHYTLNQDNIITKCVIDNVRSDACVLRYVYEYTYNVYDNMTMAERRVFFHERNEDFSELSDRYREMFEWDLNYNVFTSNEHGYQWKINQTFNYPILFDSRTYYEELVNDTNIDLPILYYFIDDCERLEFVTEWNGSHSRNLIETDNGKYFDYTYDNEFGGNDLDGGRGNIIEVNIYNKFNKRLENTYKIQYWE